MCKLQKIQTSLPPPDCCTSYSCHPAQLKRPQAFLTWGFRGLWPQKWVNESFPKVAAQFYLNSTAASAENDSSHGGKVSWTPPNSAQLLPDSGNIHIHVWLWLCLSTKWWTAGKRRPLNRPIANWDDSTQHIRKAFCLGLFSISCSLKWNSGTRSNVQTLNCSWGLHLSLCWTCVEKMSLQKRFSISEGGEKLTWTNIYLSHRTSG